MKVFQKTASVPTSNITPISMAELEEGFKLKALIFQEARRQLEARISTLKTSIQAAQQSANQEGKSSMGDKYETARAMAQLDTEMLGSQLLEAEKTLSGLDRLSDQTSAQLMPGSLARFTNGWFWLAPGGGKLILEGTTVFWVSPQAPWAKAFIGLKPSECRSFNEQTWKLEALF